MLLLVSPRIFISGHHKIDMRFETEAPVSEIRDYREKYWL
jgi:hypothetical protein